jgi:hypothetical protein
MIKHYCSNCFCESLYQIRRLTGLCQHCNSHVLLAKNRKDAKIIYNAVKKASEETQKKIDKETEKLLYGTGFRGEVVTRIGR